MQSTADGDVLRAGVGGGELECELGSHLDGERESAGGFPDLRCEGIESEDELGVVFVAGAADEAPEAIARKAVRGLAAVARVGGEPWPAHGDAAADGFAFFELSFHTGENHRLLIARNIVDDVCAVKRNGGGGVRIADANGRVASWEFIEPEFERNEMIFVQIRCHAAKVDAMLL